MNERKQNFLWKILTKCQLKCQTEMSTEMSPLNCNPKWKQIISIWYIFYHNFYAMQYNAIQCNTMQSKEIFM